MLVLGAVRTNSRARDGEGQGEAVVAGSRHGGLSVLSLFFSAEVLARPGDCGLIKALCWSTPWGQGEA